MAEYASAIIGLVLFGASVGKKLNVLIQTLKDAPDELRDLSEEVQQFQGTLDKLQQVKEQGLLDDVGCESLCTYASESLNDVQNFVTGIIQSDLREGLEKGMKRIKWFAHERRAKRLRERLQWQRSSISNLIASRTL